MSASKREFENQAGVEDRAAEHAMEMLALLKAIGIKLRNGGTFPMEGMTWAAIVRLVGKVEGKS